ncbi:MAG: glycerol-3-phosphate acyltransferase [Dehalococcoidia bacterium]|nr:glycerol-3-phosphate acyltransferase [Dehalococcoidia bacterium]MSQ17674.1 glycerol-3-phosphate acyltransferase [Dehalococcoidia bacterium]
MPWVGDSLHWGSVALAAYLIGAIPTAYVVTRLLKAQDIRRLGDNNAGAANVFRSVGRAAGVAVAVADIGKGAVVVLLARWWLDSPGAAMLAGVAAVAGHSWPVFLRLRGGRGAATGAGVLLGLLPLVAVPLSLLGLAVLFLTKSATKALACLFIPIACIAWLADYPRSMILFSLGLPTLVGLSHYLSIRRKPLLAHPLDARPGGGDAA